MKILTREKAAYLAGYIDGDGSIECQKAMQRKGKTPRYTLRLSFTAATPEPLETIATWFKLEVKIYPPADEWRSPRHRLHIPKSIAVPLLEQCLPFLILKREQAQLILRIEQVRAKYSPTRKHFGTAHLQAMPQEAVDQMEILHLKLRSLKSNKRPGSRGRPK